MLKHLIKLFFTAIILSSLSGVAQADIVENISKSFDVSNTHEFNIQNVNGDVTVTAWDKSIIEVNATIIAETQKDRDNLSVIIEQTGQGVEVKTKYAKNRNYKGNSAEVNYEVMVPSLISLSTIELVNGSLVITGLAGEIVAELVNGSIEANAIAGNTSFSSVNGSIKTSYRENIVDLNHIQLETVNGAIKLFVPEKIEADVTVETMHGNFKNDFGLTVDKPSFIGKVLHGVIGSGAVKIDINTVNGSVKILHN